MNGLVTVAEMTAFVRNAADEFLPGVSRPRGGAFEIAMHDTGQRFRVAVTEVAGLPDPEAAR